MSRLKYHSSNESVNVESRIGARVVNRLSRKEKHDAAIAIAQLKPFTRLFGRFALANSFYRAEFYASACKEFVQAYRENPESEVIPERLAISSLRSGDVELQKLAARTLMEVGRPVGDELTRIAEGIDHSLGYDAAERYYWHAFTVWDSALAHDVIVRRLREERVNQWRLLEVMESGESLHKESTSWQVSYASELAKAGRFDEAAARYSRIPGSLTPDQYYVFGYYYERAADEVSASMAYSRAVDHDKKLRAAKYGIGVFHEHHKHWNLAAQSYVDAALATSNDEVRTELYFRAGYCFEAALDYPAARRNYERAVEHNPQCMEYWFRSGVAAELAEDYKGAVSRYRVSLSVAGSDDPEVHFRIGFAEWKLGNTQGALDHFAHFVGVESGAYGLERGAVSGKRSACEDLQRPEIGELSSPKSRLGPKAHIAWGDTYFSLDDWAAAARHYDLGFLSGGLPRAKLRRQIESLVNLDRHHEACQRVIEWRKDPEAHPLKLESPRRGGFEARNIAYEQFRRNLEVRSDIILFESNLGLAVDCHPLEMSRYILAQSPGEFIHAWVVDGDVPLPPDLELHSDVIVIQKGSEQELRLFAIAGYIVNNSTFPTHPVLRGEQRYMNTWHGTPLKAMMKDTPEPLDYANISRNLLQATSLIYPSEYTKERILGRTGLGDTVRAQVEIVGSPRSDGLLGRRLSRAAETAPNQNILIAPTWRPESDIDTEVKKLVELNSTFDDAGYKVLVRAHHYVESEIKRRGLSLHIVPRTVPTNDLLKTVDVLITDYSSIFFDFAITRRPIVFYVPDWDRYNQSRGLYLEQNELPGAICTSVPEVLEAVSESSVWPGIDEFLDRFAPCEDGLATARAVKLLFSGPTARDLEIKDATRKSVLLRGEFLANGISAALISMANALNERRVRVGVLTGAEAVKLDPVRQEQLGRLADRIPIIARVGAMVNGALEYHARRVAQRGQGAPVTRLCSKLIANAYATEHRRVLGTSFWAAAVEYEGYSEFWADLILASKTAGSSTSIFMHNDIVAEIEMKFPWMERIARRYVLFDNSVSVSSELAEINQRKISERLNLKELSVQSANNVIDPARIAVLAKKSLDSDIERWLGRGTKLLLSVGRLSPEKNHSFLIEVMSAICASRDDIRLVICGDGPLRNKLQTQIVSYGLERFVLLAGHRDCIYALMNRSELFVLPSLHEGQPIVLLEAAMLETACLTSDIASIVPFQTFGVRTCELNRKDWVSLINQHLDGEQPVANMGVNTSEYIEESIDQFLKAVSGNE